MGLCQSDSSYIFIDYARSAFLKRRIDSMNLPAYEIGLDASELLSRLAKSKEMFMVLQADCIELQPLYVSTSFCAEAGGVHKHEVARFLHRSMREATARFPISNEDM